MSHANTALIIIDVQNAILDGLPLRNPAEVAAQFSATLDNINHLLAEARASGTPVLYVQHDDGAGHRLEKGTKGWEIHPQIAPLENETIVHKRACDSFFETSLESELRQRNIRHLVIAGCMTQYCVDTTCRRAVTVGFDVTLASDAHTTGDNENLSVKQIIAHHNQLLNGFDAGAYSITVKPTSEIHFV